MASFNTESEFESTFSVEFMCGILLGKSRRTEIAWNSYFWAGLA